VAERKAFLLRIDPAVLAAVQRWADDELRSLNGQIEFLLRKVLTEQGRLKEPKEPATRKTPPPRSPLPEGGRGG
jgi:hypothetical protein